MNYVRLSLKSLENLEDIRYGLNTITTSSKTGSMLAVERLIEPDPYRVSDRSTIALLITIGTFSK